MSRPLDTTKIDWHALDAAQHALDAAHAARTEAMRATSAAITAAADRRATEIERLRAHGVPVHTIASRLGVSRQAVHAALVARRQRHRDSDSDRDSDA